MNDKISIVIPTHNRSHLLKNAIETALSQIYKNIEIIVVDDASDCDNKSVIDGFNKKIKYYRFNSNQGANRCRNKGVELAIGEYIAFLDDDDTWHIDKLYKQIELMKKENIDLCYTGKNIIKVNKDLKELNRRYSYSNPKYLDIKKSIMQKNFIGTTSSILVKKDKFLQAGKFDIIMPALQDYEFYIRFINSNFNVKGINEGLIDYFIYQNNTAISKSHKKNIIAMKEIIKKNINNSYLYLLILSRVKITLKKILKG